MKLCFNERSGNPFIPDPSGGPDIEITPQIEDGLRERHNGFYVSLGMDLGVQLSNMADYLSIADAHSARDWPFTPYESIPTDIPSDIHNAAITTQLLTGYSAIFMTQKAFMESSFRNDVGNPDYPYGLMQLTPDATREGAEMLLKLPTADIILELLPELRGFKRDENGQTFMGDAELERNVIDTLRENPLASTLIAAGYNIRYSQNLVEQGVEIRAGHGYLLHFLGPGNFQNFMEAHQQNPDSIAFEALRGGADSPILSSETNQAIFFETADDGTKTPRTLQGVFEFLNEEKNLNDQPIMKSYAADFECVEMLIGEAAMQRAAEVQRPSTAPASTLGMGNGN